MRVFTFAILMVAIIPIFAQEATYEIKNMDFNTELSDFGPAFYKDNSLIFAQSKKRTTKRGLAFFNLYVVSETEKFSSKKKSTTKFSENINSPFHESNAIFTKDFKTVYFTRTNYNNGKRGKRDSEGYVVLKLYKASNIDGEWQDVKELPFNSNDYSVGHPALNADETKLYFTSNMPGTYGETDIFVVDILGENEFSTPKNLGKTINTKGKEMFPFIDENNTLYFSSTKHQNNKGGLDIYRSTFSNNVFATPENLESPINSKADDFCYIKKLGINKGYFSSNRYGGKGKDDIYAFTEIMTNNNIAMK